MKVRTITDEQDGRKWEIYKKSDNEYYYKYYEFFQAAGWRLTGQSGGHADGHYYTKEAIEYEFEIALS
ncbi:MAG TPA: hypothetical protein GX745_06290 [Clostridiales bacterium]|nr:hypothetical protein [Clostridiales bacterium]